mgnify:CR=1 FL=1
MAVAYLLDPAVPGPSDGADVRQLVHMGRQQPQHPRVQRHTGLAALLPRVQPQGEQQRSASGSWLDLF